MTVIAWDGRSLVADRQATTGTHGMPVTKLWPLPDGTGAIACCGQLDSALVLRQWYLDDADPAKYPSFQSKNDEAECVLIVARDDGTCVFYQRHPVAIPVEGGYWAWGCGREFAVGALAVGATAQEAVSVAIKHCDGCGFGTTEWTAP